MEPKKVTRQLSTDSINLSQMANFKEIVEAWKTAANPSQRDIEVAERRHRICEVCPEYKKLVGLLPYCAECLCPIDKKVFASSSASCPLGKWPV